jgi:hypothetical protein
MQGRSAWPELSGCIVRQSPGLIIITDCVGPSGAHPVGDQEDARLLLQVKDDGFARLHQLLRIIIAAIGPQLDGFVIDLLFGRRHIFGNIRVVTPLKEKREGKAC